MKGFSVTRSFAADTGRQMLDACSPTLLIWLTDVCVLGRGELAHFGEVSGRPLGVLRTRPREVQAQRPRRIAVLVLTSVLWTPCDVGSVMRVIVAESVDACAVAASGHCSAALPCA